MATKPRHRIEISFHATEIPNRPPKFDGEAWRILPVGEEQPFTFDSDMALCQPRPEYFEGHSPEQGEGLCYYSWMQPTPAGRPGFSLRVLWWEVKYKNGKEWIAGMILNESMEAPLGRLRGNLEVKIDGQVVSKTVATIHDQRGYVSFEQGSPQTFVCYEKLSWFTSRYRRGPEAPPDYFWAPQACPDARQGDSWQAAWTPYQVVDQSQEWIKRKYWNPDDPRNPPIGKMIGPVTVADWYLRITHGHFREGSQGFRTAWETAWQALGLAGKTDEQNAVLASLWAYVKAQVGGESPIGAGEMIGRPNHLSLLSGELFRANRKYNLTDADRAAPYPCVLHEGLPEIGKNGYVFRECFGRNELHYLEVVLHIFKGAYQAPNGSDFEHCASPPLLAAMILYGDPAAARQLHHICEEHVSQLAINHIHSTRASAGWFLDDLADGFIGFAGNSEFATDALRYRDAAFQMATEVWQKRLDETPYRAVLSVDFGHLITKEPDGDPLPESKWVGSEATMQLSIALHAATKWYLIESDAQRRKFWRDFADYIFSCIDQPGMIDPEHGVLQRYSIQGPAPLDPSNPKDIYERLQMTAPSNYNRRFWLSAEGWVFDAIAEYWLATGVQRAKALFDLGHAQQAKVNVAPGVGQFSPRNWSAWGHSYASIQVGGWTP